MTKLLLSLILILTSSCSHANIDRLIGYCKLAAKGEFELAWAIGDLHQEFLNEKNPEAKRKKGKFILDSVEKIRENNFKIWSGPGWKEEHGTYVIIRKWAAEFAFDIGVDEPGKSKNFYQRAIYNECEKKAYNIVRSVQQDTKSRSIDNEIKNLIRNIPTTPPVTNQIIIQQSPSINLNSCIQDGGPIYCPRYPLR